MGREQRRNLACLGRSCSLIVQNGMQVCKSSNLAICIFVRTLVHGMIRYFMVHLNSTDPKIVPVCVTKNKSMSAYTQIVRINQIYMALYDGNSFQTLNIYAHMSPNYLFVATNNLGTFFFFLSRLQKLELPTICKNCPLPLSQNIVTFRFF